MRISPAVVGYQILSFVARLLPQRLGNSIFRFFGKVAGRLNQDRRNMVERHLNRIKNSDLDSKKMQKSIDEVFASYATYWFQSFRLPGMTSEQILKDFEYEGEENLAEALRSEVGPIMVLPHLGGWEWAAFWITKVRGITLNAVVEPLEPPEVFEWFQEFRSSLGMKVIPLGVSAGSEVVTALKSKEMVVLLCDRHVGGAGVEVEFFGEKTLLPSGPATLALRTGAPLCPAAVYIQGNGVYGILRPLLKVERQGRLRDDVQRITQELAYEFETLIRKAPEQWHLLQPNWPSDQHEKA